MEGRLVAPRRLAQIGHPTPHHDGPRVAERLVHDLGVLIGGLALEAVPRGISIHRAR